METKKHNITVHLTDEEWEMFGELAYWRSTSRTEIIRAFVSDLTGQSRNSHAYDKAMEYLDCGTWQNKEGE